MWSTLSPFIYSYQGFASYWSLQLSWCHQWTRSWCLLLRWLRSLEAKHWKKKTGELIFFTNKTWKFHYYPNSFHELSDYLYWERQKKSVLAEMNELKVSVCSDSIWGKDGQHIFHQNLEKCGHDLSLLYIWIMLESSCQTESSHLQIVCVRITQSSTKENLKRNPKNNPKQSLTKKYYKWMFNIYHTCL